MRADPWHAAFVAAAAIVPLLVAGLWLTQRGERANLTAALTRLRADSARLAGRGTLGADLAARREAVRVRIEAVRGLDRSRFAWPRLLDALGRALPDGAWLTQVETTSPLPDLVVRVEGRGDTPTSITDYARSLEASRHVESVEIRGSTREVHDRGYVQAFDLLVRYRSPPSGEPYARPSVPEGE